MIKESFNEQWSVCHVGDEKNAKIVCLPHDAMLSENRSSQSAGGTNTGWFEGYDYCYEKHFFVPEDWRNRLVQVQFEQTESDMVKIEILDGDVVLAAQETQENEVTFSLIGAMLWNVQQPKLYRCRLTCGEDVQEVKFGIRVVECDAEQGFRMNGERVLLLGACVHHDNGLLGAVAHPYAERRKIKLLKRAGYNAIRCAHNPCSKALLDACDELGSETFCSDAMKFFELAKNNPALIGDFVWTGMDYLGEVGLGAWEYAEYAPNFEHEVGWIAAGAGTLDLIGTETCQAAYTQVAFELSDVRIGVIPVPFATRKHSPAAWRMTNAIESWAWNGYEGRETTVEVYARGAKADLFLNAEKIGRKKISKDGQASFTVTYQSGELTAVIYDETEKEIARTSLYSAQEETQLSLYPEENVIEPEDLCYVHLKYTDTAGTLKPAVRGKIHLDVKGGKLLAFGSACPYNEIGFLTDTSDTYYGEAMAVIQPEGIGSIEIYADSPYGKAEISVQCERK